MALTSRSFIVAVAVSLAFPVVPAQADETGLASIHEWRREGGRICMSEHFHSGSGSGPTKKAAESEAVASWVSFTVFEYGTIWGSFQRAASKGVACKPKGDRWQCDVEARPCRTK